MSVNDLLSLCVPCIASVVSNMLRVWVCAAHMDGFLGPKFIEQGSLFGRFSLRMDGLSRNLQKIVENGWFPPKFIIKVGVTASFGN